MKSKLYKEEELIEILKDKYNDCKEYNIEATDEEINERFNHSIGVKNACLKINEFFNLGLDKDILINMGLLHDYSKFLTIDDYKKLLEIYPNATDENYLTYSSKVHHALLGDLALKHELGINDPIILNAIKYHSTGNKNLDIYSEVLMLADYTEETREGDSFKNARSVLYESNDPINIKKALCYILASKIKHIKARGFSLVNETYYAYLEYKPYLDNPLDRCKQILRAIDHNLVKDICIYDVHDRSPLYDYVIVSTAVSNKSKDAVISYLRAEFDLRSVEEGEFWTLVDLNDCILHVFSNDARSEYNIDRILNEARKINIE